MHCANTWWRWLKGGGTNQLIVVINLCVRDARNWCTEANARGIRGISASLRDAMDMAVVVNDPLPRELPLLTRLRDLRGDEVRLVQTLAGAKVTGSKRPLAGQCQCRWLLPTGSHLNIRWRSRGTAGSIPAG